MRKEGISKHEAILKAKDFIGVPVQPKLQPKPIAIPEQPEQTKEQRTLILTETFKHFARRPISSEAVMYCKIASYKYDYKRHTSYFALPSE
jgi:hypothetical protein